MSASLYQTELSAIISETKRKHQEVRSSAEAALHDLKSITVTSEQQLAADLAQKPSFADPFLKACLTNNTKLAVSGVNGLQRLVITQSLPTSQLSEALRAFNACTELGLDIQLKVLQALPSLVQNYANELKDDLLSSTLQACASLQGAKVSTVSAVAAATLQQLTTAVFARITEEDAQGASITTVAEVTGGEESIALRPAAYDGYRVLQDLILAAEDRKTKFVQLQTLSRENCLELIECSLEAKPRLLSTHEELANLVRTSVIPLITLAISDLLSFSVTVRCIRLLRILCTKHFSEFASDLDTTLGLFAHGLEPDTPMWKRVLLMEILRDVCTENGHIVLAFMKYDQRDKSIVQDLMASFVRLSSEKPGIIGLSQQSTIPAGPPEKSDDSTADIRAGMAGMLSSLGVAESSIQGISTQWSVPRHPCHDHLDKAEPPPLPETYIYILVLECLSGLADSLAKIVLPLTVHKQQYTGNASIPANPLQLDDTPAVQRAKSVALLIENCWPAVLATCSTFMNAALDDALYRGLIKSYQRFAQVAGLLRLSTPRDALMTSLGKAAVPPQILNAVVSSNDNPQSPVPESPRSFSGARNMLSIEGLVSQASASFSLDKDRRSSIDAARPMLTVRNLLCLRALLNLAIALGPTLESAFVAVVHVLEQTDIVLSATGLQQMSRSGTNHSDAPAFVQAFTAEVTAVESAVTRLLESTVDYSDEAFVAILEAFCLILRSKAAPLSPTMASPSTSTPTPRQRTFSGLSGIEHSGALQLRSLQFALNKLSTLVALNIPRFLSSEPEESGWYRLTADVLAVAISNANSGAARRSATDLLCDVSAECISAVSQEKAEERKTQQLRYFTLLRSVIQGIYEEDGQLTSMDLEVPAVVIATVRAILEKSGDTIIAGWGEILSIVSSSFESEMSLLPGAASKTDGAIVVDWSKVSNEFASGKLGRDAFGVLQLICNEFFTLLPLDKATWVIELLTRYMSQESDLNLSLTGITVLWNVADMLFQTRERSEDIITIARDEELDTALSKSANTSRTSQWLLCLAKLRSVVASAQLETAKAAFQTICSISKNNAAHLPIEIWVVVLRHILIGVLQDESRAEPTTNRDLAPILLAGSAEVFAEHIELFETMSDLQSTWSDYLKVQKHLLDKIEMTTVQAVFESLTKVLAQLTMRTKAWIQPINQTASLWTQRDPSQVELDPPGVDNQAVFLAYTGLATQLVRLFGQDIEKPFTDSILANLTSCIQSTHASFYGADVSSLSPLQREVLQTIQMLPSTIEGISLGLVDCATQFAMMHQTSKAATNRPSYVALAAASIEWLRDLVMDICERRLSDKHVGVVNALGCLGNLVEEKYQFQTGTRGKWLWQRAISVATELSGPVVAWLALDSTEDEVRLEVMHPFSIILQNVILANGLDTFGNDDRAYDDETDDIATFKEMCKVLMTVAVSPAFVGMVTRTQRPNDFELLIITSMIEGSIIHPGVEEKLSLEDNYSPRSGRVKKVLPCRRERMAYACFDQLVSLATGSAIEGRTPLSVLNTASWLTIRLAIPIRAYIADQPLRGRMPQPLSELEELLFVFEQIKTLQLRGQEVVGRPDSRWSNLYPLLLKALRVASDKWCGSQEVLLPLQSVLEVYRAT